MNEEQIERTTSTGYKCPKCKKDEINVQATVIVELRPKGVENNTRMETLQYNALSKVRCLNCGFDGLYRNVISEEDQLRKRVNELEEDNARLHKQNIELREEVGRLNDPTDTRTILGKPTESSEELEKLRDTLGEIT